MKQYIAFALLILAWANLATARNPMENPDLFEGDMLGVKLDENRNAVPYDSQRWPGGVVPYEINSNLTGNHLIVTLQAMTHIQKKTCIKFVPRKGERDYVHIFYGEGCAAHWGRIGGQQILTLGYLCDFLGTAIHELMHAIGFEHEHNRSDRDDYVTIMWENIEREWYYAFKKLLPNENRLLTSFDYDSIMCYGSTAFTTGPNINSMVRKNGAILEEVYDKKELSASDIKRVNMLYNCPN